MHTHGKQSRKKARREVISYENATLAHPCINTNLCSTVKEILLLKRSVKHNCEEIQMCKCFCMWIFIREC